MNYSLLFFLLCLAKEEQLHFFDDAYAGKGVCGLTIVFVYLTAAISTAAFLALWFWVVYRELREKKNTMESAAVQLAVCKRQARLARDEREKEDAQGVLDRSLDIYRQSVNLYHQTLKKPWNYLPGCLMGYREVRGGNRVW